MHKFSDIDQFRTLLRGLTMHFQYAGKDAEGRPTYDSNRELPTLDFVGTVKLHGTSNSFVIKGSQVTFQSRTQEISIGSDNAGFAAFYSSTEKLHKIRALAADLRALNNLDIGDDIVIYGEWCGKGIQKGVAVNQLDKMFVIFAVKHLKEEGGVWLNFAGARDESISVYNILDYPTFEIAINLNDPTEDLKKIEEWVNEVEKECPVGKAFGVSGIGEGIVFSTVLRDGSVHRFKSKGEAHSVSKTSKPSTVDTEKLKGIQEFVDYAATENRFEQGFQQLFVLPAKIPTEKNTGEFLAWVNKDIAKEETDTLSDSGFSMKEVSGAICAKARKWFFENLDRKI